MNHGHAHNSDPVRHLYVHFPFCARICPYCAFYKTRGNASDLAEFCEALLTEAAFVARKFPLALETVFFGGGTPTALNTRQLKNLLGRFGEIFDFTMLREFTIEANPGSVSAKKAAALRDGGITRVSLGVQSWDDGLLRLLGREHDAEIAEKSLRIFREIGFPNISLDLMFALPGQTERQWSETLQKTVVLSPEHVSTYCLTYEEDTEFFARLGRGEFQLRDETEGRFFEIAMDVLGAAAYEQYEISNFARPGFQSEHNRAYWRGEDYLGVGPSAFSTRGSARWQNVPDHREWGRRLLAGESAAGTIEQLTKEMKRTEAIALGLRTREGVSVDVVAADRLSPLIESHLLARRADQIVLTNAGKLVADSVAEELL